MTKTIKDQVAGSDTTNDESSQQGRGCEEQCDLVIPKPRGKSKDLTVSFESRLTQVEEDMGAVDAHMENLDKRVEGLEADIAETHEEVREALNKLGESNPVDLQALRDEFMAEVAPYYNYEEAPKPEAQRFYDMLKSIGTPLYEECTKHFRCPCVLMKSRPRVLDVSLVDIPFQENVDSVETSMIDVDIQDIGLLVHESGDFE
ncbi:hypothetical protein M9H77_06498 [Catharanthus roseus]|uniref:Uncharacterized protein n=1 Tax=Catharanthus roseus TaxID=4058 RepID=A0ACC0BSA1_CATRO|nr:hypothetical protein M9H77_06498 [Catharanthus roseus]